VIVRHERDDYVDPGRWPGSLVLSDGAALPLLTGAAQYTTYPIVAACMGVVGILAFRGEHRHGTLVSTLVPPPRRDVLVAAACVVVGAWSSAVALVSIALNWIVGLLLLDGPLEITGEVAVGLLYYVWNAVLWALLGVGLGILGRSVLRALGVWWIIEFVQSVIESAAMRLLMGDAGVIFYYLPRWSSSFMLHVGEYRLVDVYGPIPSKLVASLVCTAWVTLLLVVAMNTFSRRDASARSVTTTTVAPTG
jgi:hypothetical protein